MRLPVPASTELVGARAAGGTGEASRDTELNIETIHAASHVAVRRGDPAGPSARRRACREQGPAEGPPYRTPWRRSIGPCRYYTE